MPSLQRGRTFPKRPNGCSVTPGARQLLGALGTSQVLQTFRGLEAHTRLGPGSHVAVGVPGFSHNPRALRVTDGVRRNRDEHVWPRVERGGPDEEPQRVERAGQCAPAATAAHDERQRAISQRLLDPRAQAVEHGRRDGYVAAPPRLAGDHVLERPCLIEGARLHRNPPRFPIAAMIEQIEDRLEARRRDVHRSRPRVPRFERAAIRRHTAVDAATGRIADRLVPRQQRAKHHGRTCCEVPGMVLGVRQKPVVQQRRHAV